MNRLIGFVSVPIPHQFGKVFFLIHLLPIMKRTNVRWTAGVNFHKRFLFAILLALVGTLRFNKCKQVGKQSRH